MGNKPNILGNKRWVLAMFALGMFGMSAMCGWLTLITARSSEPTLWFPLPMALVALLAGIGATSVMLKGWRMEHPPEVGMGQQHQLRPDSSHRMAFLGWLGIALVWNGFINGAFVLFLINESYSVGRLALLGGFWLLFAIPGVITIKQTIRSFRVMVRGDRTLAEISHSIMELGQQATVEIQHWSRFDTQMIKARVVCSERNRRTIMNVLHEQVLGERQLSRFESQPWQATFTFSIPSNAQPTTQDQEARPVSWDVVVDVQPVAGPGYTVRFPFTVIEGDDIRIEERRLRSRPRPSGIQRVRGKREQLY